MMMMRFSWLPASLIALLLTTTEAADQARPRRTLSPVHKRGLLKSRDFARASMLPQDVVHTTYGEAGEATLKSPVVYSADLHLLAHDGQRLVLLEDFEDLISSIRCHGEGMDLRFHDAEDATFAHNSWSTGNPFVMVTSHSYAGCNSPTDREPHLIDQVIYQPSEKTIRFSSQPIDWDVAYESVRVSLDYTRPSTAPEYTALVRRDGNTTAISPDASQGNATVSFAASLDPRDVLYSGSDTESLPGVSAEASGSVAITCVGCGTSGQVLIKGAVDVKSLLLKRNAPPDELQARASSAQQLKTAFLQVEVVEELKAVVNLELFASASLRKTVSKTLTVNELTPFVVGGLTIGPILEFNISATMSSGAASVNFTYGAEVTVPLGANATLDWANMNNSQAHGWDQAGFSELPFVLNDLSQDFSFGLNLSASPMIKLGVAVGPSGLFGEAGAGFGLDLPTVFAKGTYHSNVTSDCQAPNASDFTYHTDAVLIEGGASVNLNLVANAHAGATSDEFPDFMKPSYSETLLSKDLFSAQRCMAFNRTALGELKLANETAPSIDIAKVETAFQQSGTIPSGVDPAAIATYTAQAVPSDLEAAAKGEVKAGSGKGVANGTAKAGAERVAGGAGAAWMGAMVAVGMALVLL